MKLLYFVDLRIVMGSGTLIITDEVGFPVRTIRDLGSEGVAEDDVVVITQCGSLGKLVSSLLGGFECYRAIRYVILELRS